MARREDWSFGISLSAREKGDDGVWRIAQPFELKPIANGELITPLARIDIQSAQELMDELWQCGVRPTEGTGSAGALAATERHLRDMQQIAIGVLKKNDLV